MSVNRLPVSYILIGISIIVSFLAFSSPDIFAALMFQVGPIMNGEFNVW